MRFRQYCGFALGLLGAFFMWRAGIGLAQLAHAGMIANPIEVLLSPDQSLRIVASLAAFLGGLAALTERRGGAWLAGISSFLFCILTFKLMADPVLYAWRDEAIYLTILTGLFLCLVVARRQSDAKSSETRAKLPLEA